MAITALTIALNRTFFSRYEPDRSMIQATVTQAGGVTGETIQASLVRRTMGADLTVATATRVLAATPETTMVFSFSLPAIKDTNGLSTIRASHTVRDYTVRVTNVPETVAAEQSLTVTPITAESMKSSYLKGLPLVSTERLAVRLQPQVVTGVVVNEVSFSSQVGPGVLAFTNGSPDTLSWAGGTVVQMVPGVTEYVLSDTTGAYLAVTVTATSLPGASVNETLFVDLARMSDEEIVEEVLRTYAAITTAMRGELEPARVVTEKILALSTVPLSYDRIGMPANFYRQDQTARWLALRIPHHNVLYVHQLSGWFNQNKAVDINDDWRVTTERSGQVQLVPSNAALLNWNFLGIGIQAFLTSQISVPNFWNYEATVGLREIPLELLQFIGKRTAMSLLASAGAMRYAAGVTSTSLSRDGVSESRGLNPKGAYAGLIDQYAADTGRQSDGKEVLLKRLRDRYMGTAFTTL